eukprot:2747956-Rhodomonas_salina.1
MPDTCATQHERGERAANLPVETELRASSSRKVQQLREGRSDTYAHARRRDIKIPLLLLAGSILPAAISSPPPHSVENKSQPEQGRGGTG